MESNGKGGLPMGAPDLGAGRRRNEAGLSRRRRGTARGEPLGDPAIQDAPRNKTRSAETRPRSAEQEAGYTALTEKNKARVFVGTNPRISQTLGAGGFFSA